MKKILTTCLLILFTSLLFAQNGSDRELALKYFRNKEFDKAAEVYERLYNTSKSSFYFTYYINCLVQLERIDEAIKVVKKQIKKNSGELKFIVELGYLYKQNNDSENADQQYEKAIKKVPLQQNHIIGLANTFVSKREFAYAEKLYLYGRKELKGNYTFNYELASVYRYQRNFEKMIDEYLDLLLIHESYIQSVQNSLQATIYNEDESDLNPILKGSLINRIQKYPNKIIFSELLIWLYLQEKDFENAYYQTKALDKRNNEHGKRLISLGNLALSNKDYDVAKDCYKYVVELGNNKIYYVRAKNKYLNALYNKIVSNAEYKQQEIVELETNYHATIIELGKSAETFDLLIDLAHIQAFYLEKEDEAIKLLNEILFLRGLNNKQISACKIELGNVLVFTNEPWEAILLYAQVEKANENNPTGHEAKFKKAKLAYYICNFKWAQAQLDVLKASTSKLIANDAFELATLINDNLAMDTTEIPLNMFAKADLLIYQNKDSLAILTLDSIKIMFPTHSLNDEILYKKAQIYKKKKQFEKAAEYYQMVITNHGYDILADNSMFYLADLYQNYLNNKEKAMELYKKIMTDYPGSIYVVESRKQFRLLRGDKPDKEMDFFKGIHSDG